MKATRPTGVYLDDTGSIIGLEFTLSQQVDLDEVDYVRGYMFGTLRTLNMTCAPNAQLTGSLPTYWPQYFPSLNTLVLSGCSVSGPLPPQWSAFPVLRWLDLSNNQISGEVPEEWLNLLRRNASLMDLINLSGNQLQGVPVSSSAPLSWFGAATALPEPWMSQVCEDSTGIVVMGSSVGAAAQLAQLQVTLGCGCGALNLTNNPGVAGAGLKYLLQRDSVNPCLAPSSDWPDSQNSCYNSNAYVAVIVVWFVFLAFFGVMLALSFVFQERLGEVLFPDQTQPPPRSLVVEASDPDPRCCAVAPLEGHSIVTVCTVVFVVLFKAYDLFSDIVALVALQQLYGTSSVYVVLNILFIVVPASCALALAAFWFMAWCVTVDPYAGDVMQWTSLLMQWYHYLGGLLGTLGQAIVVTAAYSRAFSEPPSACLSQQIFLMAVIGSLFDFTMTACLALLGYKRRGIQRRIKPINIGPGLSKQQQQAFQYKAKVYAYG